MSVTISWTSNPESDDIATYHVERSIVGVQTTNAAPYNIAAGSTMQVRVDGGNLVTITFNAITAGAATAAQVAAVIDGVLNPYGGSAKVTDSGDKVIIYSNRQTDRGSLNIKGGTALAGLGILSKVYKHGSNPVEVGTVAAPGSSFTDADGENGYKYRIFAENSAGAYSDPTEWFCPFREVIPTSVIYGNIVGPDGKALDGVVIEYGPPLNKRPSDDTLNGSHPNSGANVGVSIQFKSTLTNENGYFQMVVPANISIRLKIDSIGHDFVYKTPQAGTATDFTDLKESFSYESFALADDWWSTTV